MKKAAFTIIEIIFVIVILGILAAVAIPMMTATRKDAKVSSIAQNIAITAAEISTYAVAHGDTNDDFSTMSKAIVSLQNSGNATLSNNKAVILIDGENCLEIKVQKTATNNDLIINLLSTNNDMCTSVQSLIDAAKYPMRLRGRSVVY